MPKKARRFSRETKLTVVQRMLTGENIAALSRELNILRKDLYKWRAVFLSGGPAAFRDPGRPPGAGAKPEIERPSDPRTGMEKAQRRIADLEKKVRRQEIELKSIREALRRFGVKRRRKDDEGGNNPVPPHDAK